jgi:hypothetical protein
MVSEDLSYWRRSSLYTAQLIPGLGDVVGLPGIYLMAEKGGLSFLSTSKKKPRHEGGVFLLDTKHFAVFAESAGGSSRAVCLKSKKRGREAVARKTSETRSKGLHHAAHVAARHRGLVLRQVGYHRLKFKTLADRRWMRPLGARSG